MPRPRILEPMVLKVLGTILAVWLAVVVVGAVVHALWWLILIGAIAFVVTSAVGYSRRNQVGYNRRNRLR